MQTGKTYNCADAPNTTHTQLNFGQAFIPGGNKTLAIMLTYLR